MRQVWQFSQTRWVGLFFFFFCFFPHFIVLAFYLRNIWIIIYHPSVALVFIYFQSRYRLFWGESACSVLHFNEDGENWAELCFPSVLGYFCYINSANLFFFMYQPGLPSLRSAHYYGDVSAGPAICRPRGQVLHFHYPAGQRHRCSNNNCVWRLQSDKLSHTENHFEH